ncbi:MAG: TonB C-terminal domain-containing protein [Deltaproteobacteria bacterium]|nr:TonB C-terminal domain-containing protein [Deltaproteobacteria bacterium]
MGPIGVRGGSGNLLQDVRLGVYTESLWEKIHANWSVPPSVEGKGYVAIVSFTWNRQGKITQMTLEKSSGNRLYDQAALRAIEATSQKGDLAIPRDIPGESMELGIRFRKDD